MSDTDALAERLEAVERALTDGEADLTDLRDAVELTRELDALAERVEALEARADELDAATQALRGYVGNVQVVNESIERRADAALAKAESLDAQRGPMPPTTRDRSDPTCTCERASPGPEDASEAETEASDGLLARFVALFA